MDHSNVDVKIGQEAKTDSNFDAYVTEDGKQYRVPYRTIKRALFTDLKRAELIDIPHAARLQYRLMLLDPVIKATVDFTKSKITILYNPREADNIREKISIEELIDFLSKQGINVEKEKMTIEDYDYYKQLYTYAYNPDKIRERIPYGHNAEDWKKMKPVYDQKYKDDAVKKMEKYREMQQSYLEENPQMAPIVDPNFKPREEEKVTFFGKLLGKGKSKNKKTPKEKGFWFHGV